MRHVYIPTPQTPTLCDILLGAFLALACGLSVAALGVGLPLIASALLGRL